MTDTAKLIVLYDRMTEEQRRMVDDAASRGVLPTTGMMRRMADLESALAAVDTTIQELTPTAGRKS